MEFLTVRIFRFLTNFAIFYEFFDVRGFFNMENTSLKEFFDFDHGKVPHKGLKPQKRGLTLYGVPLCKPFFDHIPEV